MKKLFLLLILTLFSFARSQNFNQFLVDISALPDSLKQAKADSFYNALSRLPLVEQDSLVTFIYRGSGGVVSWAGDANGWDPTASLFQKVSGTSLWYRLETYESYARLDYKLVLNGNN